MIVVTTVGDTVALTGWTCTPTPAVGASVTCTPDTPLAEGTTTPSVTITDLAGNVSTATTPSLTIDTTAPTGLSITSIGGDTSDPFITNDTTPELIVVTAIDDSVTLTGWTCTPTPATTTTVTCTPDSALGEGTTSLTITVTDLA
jgi:hypothetical protein